jgi:VIT1/CCC1 family predicted Fe2+/Mn2+ transporter
MVMLSKHGYTSDDDSNPLADGLMTFCSFVLFGSIPLLPYFFSVAPEHRFGVAIASTFIALALLGAARSIVTREKYYRGPIEILLVGAVGAVVAFLIGYAFRTVFGIAA